MPFRLDVRKLASQLQTKLGRVTANDFRPEIRRYAARALATSIAMTPTREISIIRKSQEKQYANRINYIPTVHDLLDPTLIVDENGAYWLYANGRWWAASYRDMPSDIDMILQDLVAERERRLQTAEGEFIEDRAQARLLYRKSWWQVAESIGVPLAVSSDMVSSRSRPYHAPSGEPPRAYGQWRGGKHVLSIVVFNSFLQKTTRYWKKINGKTILMHASSLHHAEFMGECAAKMEKLLTRAR